MVSDWGVSPFYAFNGKQVRYPAIIFPVKVLFPSYQTFNIEIIILQVYIHEDRPVETSGKTVQPKTK